MTKWGKYWDWESIPKSSLKSRVRSINEANVEGKLGEYGTSKQLVGGTDIPTERLSIGVTSFKAGDRAPFHFHLHERVYYMISGRAILRDIEGLSYQDIADTLRININTVRSRLKRARLALMEAVSKGVIQNEV